MKKFKSIYLLLLSAIPLTACGSQNIPPQEAVKKELPALVKATVDTYNESECMTISGDFASFNVAVNYGDYNIEMPISGNVTFGLRNMYTSDISLLQAGAVFNNCDIGFNFQKTGEEKKQYEIKDFTFGIYLHNGNLYIDVSETKAIDSLAGFLASLSDLNESTIKVALGSGKYKIENVLKEELLPLIKKESLSEEGIANKIKEVFGFVNDDDLEKVMTLVHDNMKDTYNLSFDVKDPDIINRTYSNMEASVPVKCDEVDMHVETWTDNKSVFTGLKVKGNVSIKEDSETSSSYIKLATDGELSLNFKEYAIKNPSFSSFRSPAAIALILVNIANSLFGPDFLPPLG